MTEINILDRRFTLLFDEKSIREKVREIAMQINVTMQNPLFIGVLNGSFIFASDLLKEITHPCQIEFIKVASYEGVNSTHKIKKLLGLNLPIEGRHIIILEDIIDTGLTLEYLIKDLVQHKPASIKICCLLLKPAALKADLEPDFVGFEVENNFLVGYGMDYNGYGRNLKHIYKEESLS